MPRDPPGDVSGPARAVWQAIADPPIPSRTDDNDARSAVIIHELAAITVTDQLWGDATTTRHLEQRLPYSTREIGTTLHQLAERDVVEPAQLGDRWRLTPEALAVFAPEGPLDPPRRSLSEDRLADPRDRAGHRVDDPDYDPSPHQR